jgi:mRNA interferase RelE/StbE
MFKISWKPKALKQLEKIKDIVLRNKIFDAIDSLSDFPNCKNIKMLKNHQHAYRLRVGSYRVLFDIQQRIRVISIEEVKKRNEHTYAH